jgi:haloacetate dehalogenase
VKPFDSLRSRPKLSPANRLAFRDPTVRHAICEDYRAAMNEDLDLDMADRTQGRKLGCPVQVLWPSAETCPGAPNPIAIWSRWADDVVGATTSGGHLQPEDAPDEVLVSLRSFLNSHLSAVFRRYGLLESAFYIEPHHVTKFAQGAR